MQLIYDLGKSYTTSIYDDIVYDRLTRENSSIGKFKYKFLNGNYIIHLQNELKNLDYINFCRLLIDLGIYNETLRDTSASMTFSRLAQEFKGDKKNKMFFSLIQKIAANINPINDFCFIR